MGIWDIGNRYIGIFNVGKKTTRQIVATEYVYSVTRNATLDNTRARNSGLNKYIIT